MTLIMFFEFLIGMTDIYIAGRVGKEIQATYGFVVQFYFIFIIIANALSIGTVSVVSRLFTAGDRSTLAETVWSIIVTTAVSGAVLSAAGIFFTSRFMEIVNIPAELKLYGTQLGKIYACGLVFHYLLISTNGILRSCRMIRRSLVTMAIACLLNITLNFIIVFHTRLGFWGIALSTALSVFAGSILNLGHCRVFLDKARTFSFRIVRDVVSIGWPAGVTQALWQVHSMVMFLILSSLPEKSIEILAALATGTRIESAIFLPAIAFNMANAVIVGNLIGEGKKRDAFRGGLVTMLMGVGIVVLLTVVVITGARWIALLLSHNGTVIAETIRYLYINMLSEPFMALWVILGGGLSGAGDTRSIMFNVIIGIWLVRIPLSYILVVLLGFGAVSVWWTMNLSQLIMAVFITRRYWQRKWLM
ncbi:MAG: Multidrug resistance protein NorM [Syntrophorhabdus sp. PtaU1.Bin058]|nr:MAG: Multidrug resistance protein NorM [Syntrophorhabdus sp. PtaU1.Bin058]